MTVSPATEIRHRRSSMNPFTSLVVSACVFVWQVAASKALYINVVGSMTLKRHHRGSADGSADGSGEYGWSSC